MAVVVEKIEILIVVALLLEVVVIYISKMYMIISHNLLYLRYFCSLGNLLVCLV